MSNMLNDITALNQKTGLETAADVAQIADAVVDLHMKVSEQEHLQRVRYLSENQSPAIKAAGKLIEDGVARGELTTEEGVDALLGKVREAEGNEHERLNREYNENKKADSEAFLRRAGGFCLGAVGVGGLIAGGAHLVKVFRNKS